MYAEKTEIGIDGIVLSDLSKKIRIKWKDIIGVNNCYYREEIYLSNGCMMKLRPIQIVFTAYEVFDYGQEKVGVGEPIKMHDWDLIYWKIKQYIRERGVKYIEDLEWIYSGYFIRLVGKSKKGINLPIEEKRDLMILDYGIGYSIFCLLSIIVFALIIGPNRTLFDESYSLIFKIALGILVSFWAIFPIFFLRRSKIKNVFRRNGLSYFPKSVLYEVIEDQNKMNSGAKKSLINKMSDLFFPK